MNMKRAILYFRESDSDIQKIKITIEESSKRNDLDYLFINIDSIPDKESIPVKSTPCLIVGPYTLKTPINMSDIDIAISAAAANPDKDRRVSPKNAKIKNSAGIFLSNFYPAIIALMLLTFVLGAFIAPYQMSIGKELQANRLYDFYRIFCHQLAFRSYFILGEQLFYPRDLAGIEGKVTYEYKFDDPIDNVDIAREIKGNSVAGYKVALCQRDIAIYSALALSALLFQFLRNKIKPIRWYFWFLIALLPIGLDGFSQIPGLSAGWPNWFPIRESTPFIRSITGFLFGGMTGLYMFPLMEESMADTNQQLKMQRVIIDALIARKKSNG